MKLPFNGETQASPVFNILKSVMATAVLLSLPFSCKPTEASQLADAALICAALNLYHEGRGEPLLGQVGIVHVVRNRAKDNPANVCKVVYAYKQFSWTLTNPQVTDLKKFDQILHTTVIAWQFSDITSGSNHYHHVSIRPYWIHKMKYTMTLGTHRYYRSQ